MDQEPEPEIEQYVYDVEVINELYEIDSQHLHDERIVKGLDEYTESQFYLVNTTTVLVGVNHDMVFNQYFLQRKRHVNTEYYLGE